MVSAVRTVSSATAMLVPAKSVLPPAVWAIFNAVNTVHSTWRWYRWSKIYSNPDNFFQITSGHLLNFAVGDRLLVRIAAQCVLISSCIIDCAEQQAALARAYEKWKDSLAWKFSTPMSCQWKKDAKWISPSSIQKISKIFHQLSIYLQMVAYRTYKLFLHIFKLSMKTMDAVEAFSLSPSTRNETVNEFFLNCTKCLDALELNQNELVEKLQKNKQIIAKILLSIGAEDKTDQLISYVSQSLEKVRSLNDSARKVNHAANVVMLDLVRNGLVGIFTLVDVANFLPEFLLPVNEDIVVGTKLYERYPPVQWVTRTDQKKDKPSNRMYWEKEILPFQPTRYVLRSA